MAIDKKPIVLQASKIKKSFYHPLEVCILKQIDLIVRRGDTVAITGRSGEGKSTLLQILGTLEQPCQGSLEVVGERVTAFNKAKIRNRNLSFVFQAFHLFEDCTAIENVLMPAQIARKRVSKGSAAYERAEQLLEQVGLSKRAHFSVKHLSGGEKQRVAIARALCNNPDIIFADEPSGNLDKNNAQLIHQLLLDFAKENDKALIVVTHDPSLASLCTQQYLLERGCLTSCPS